MKPSKPVSASDYPAFLASLKKRIMSARVSAARAVNRDLVLLYWDIGKSIVEKQRAAGWGEAVVEHLAADLRAEFPDMGGFSADNLWRMRQIYSEYSRIEFLEQVVPEMSGKSRNGKNQELLAQAVRDLVINVPWGHHLELLKKVHDAIARIYYLRATAQFGWSRNVLLNQIKAGAFERAVKEKKAHNFPLALPEYLAEQADEMMKSRYNLEFLGISRAVKERDLENRLIDRLQQFILELGYGFCFIGRQYRLEVGRKEYFVDLLFYHRFLKSLVAFDLKIGPFVPEHAGKMDFYLNVLNARERAKDDRPSIGIILCAEKDDVEVEFALKSKKNPIGVAEYHLQPQLPSAYKGRMPTAKQLAAVVREAFPKRQ